MHRSRAPRRRRPGQAFARAALALALLGSFGAGCSKKGPAVVKSAERPATDDDVDRDPLALLPAGAVLVGRLDAHALFASSLGPKSQSALDTIVPLGPAAGFVAERDLESVVLAAYSTQGADFAFVARGSFDPTAIERAAAQGAKSPYGGPWVKGEYAGRTIYSAGDGGFAPLTKKTALGGTHAGLRRALDRLRFGAPKVDLPAWASDVTSNAAPLAVAGEWGDQPLASEVVSQAPFLQGLRGVRMTGNFGPPGLNADGSLAYPSPETATDAEGRVRAVGQLAALASIIGLSPIHDLRSEVSGDRVHVVVAVEGRYLARWLEVMPTLVPMVAPAPPPNPG